MKFQLPNQTIKRHQNKMKRKEKKNGKQVSRFSVQWVVEHYSGFVSNANCKRSRVLQRKKGTFAKKQQKSTCKWYAKYDKMQQQDEISEHFFASMQKFLKVFKQSIRLLVWDLSPTHTKKKNCQRSEKQKKNFACAATKQVAFASVLVN